MRWTVRQELSAREQRVVAKLRQRSKFFVFLREIRHDLFDGRFQQELATAYEPRGQPPVPPALLAMVTLLQAYTGASDAEAVEAAEMDRRWQLVLGTLGSGAPFGQGSLVRFRARLLESELDQRLVDRTVDLAKASGKFGWQRLRVALDSSPLLGAGRVEDGWNLIGHAMKQLVHVLARLAHCEESEIIEDSGVSVLHGTSLKAALDIDWDDVTARHQALGQVVGQARELVSWAHQRLPETMRHPDVVEAVSLLQTVIDQNTEPDPETPGGLRVPRGVPPDRVCSVGDPAMRHGRKSKSKAFNGYKRHVVTHVDVPLVLGARALPANVPENEAVPALLDDIEKYGSLSELLIDRGYVSHDRVSALSGRGIPVRCRPWPQNNNKGGFTKADFQIDLRSRTVVCPQGHQASFTEKSRLAKFSAHDCAVCPLRPRCTTSKGGRTVAVHPQEALLRKLVHAANTSNGRKRLRKRVPVEHRLARIQSKQGGRARYKGTRMNTFDLRRHAALANLLELRCAVAA